MNGIEFHAELARRAPELAARIVFLTGGACDETAERFLKGVANRVLQKPVRIQTLREILDADFPPSSDTHAA